MTNLSAFCQSYEYVFHNPFDLKAGQDPQLLKSLASLDPRIQNKICSLSSL